LTDSVQRVALVVEYDGSRFNGWQLQRGSEANTVQAALESALGSVADAPVRLVCAGRTDAGVHATHQVVHFESANPRGELAWLRGCNANLPGSVAVRGARIVGDDFHARFSALSRRYRYLIHDREARPALGREYLTWVRRPLDVRRMHAQAQALLGERDFTSFRAAACRSSTPMRRVDFVRVERRRRLVVVDIQANAFLHHMVRNIVGTLIEVGKGRARDDWVATLLALKDRTRAADTAPPAGLYLVGVNYPERFGLKAREPGPVWLGE